MAPGIYKTFRKVWNNNVKKAIEFGLINSDINMSIKTSKQLNYDNSGETPISITDEIIDRFLGRNLAFTLVNNNADSHYNGDKEQLIKNIKDIIKMTIEDTEIQCYQAMEGIVHNLNTLHSRAGAQVPFSSINLGTDTSNAGRMVTKNLLLAMEAGLGHGETAIFPIVIFKVKEGVNYNPEDPNYDLLQLSYRVTAKRLFPKLNWGSRIFC